MTNDRIQGESVIRTAVTKTLATKGPTCAQEDHNDSNGGTHLGPAYVKTDNTKDIVQDFIEDDGFCKCICTGNDDVTAAVGADCGDGIGDTMKGEMAQCALHVFSPAETFFSEEGGTCTILPTKTPAKSSCFTISCATCAKQISHSSLCVHGRRRNPTLSIRKDVSDQVNTSVGTGSIENKESSKTAGNFLRENVDGEAKYDSDVASTGKSVVCLKTLKQLLCESDENVLGRKEKGENQEKCLLDSLIRAATGDSSSDENRCLASIESDEFVKNFERNNNFGEGHFFAKNFSNSNDNEPCLIDLSEPQGFEAAENFRSELLSESGGASGELQTEPTEPQLPTTSSTVAESVGVSGLLENGENFEASNRLKRLEEHFKGFVFTKKLLKDECTVTDGSNNRSLHHQQCTCESRNDSSTSIDTHTSAAAAKQHTCLQELSKCSSSRTGIHSSLSSSADNRCTFRTNSDIDPASVDFITINNFSYPGCSYVILNNSSSPFVNFGPSNSAATQVQLCDPLNQHVNKTAEQQGGNNETKDIECTSGNTNPSDCRQHPLEGAAPSAQLNCTVARSNDAPGADNDNNYYCPLLFESLKGGIKATTPLNKIVVEPPAVSCSEFDVRYLQNFQNYNLALECYDEFEVENNCGNSCYFGNDSLSSTSTSSSSHSQCCLIEAVPLFRHHYHHHHYRHLHQLLPTAMRELNGPLRGLLKKPNRPPQARKNRVVFDETRNEFFEADYIILIREDCAYDEEDEEPCTCGEHELVRLCCEEGCQCNYSEENRTPQSPKFAPPIEFVDEAALSPPDGYKDNGLKNALSGALTGHVFGAQHIQQLQVIQRLQQQRAAMLAARASNQQIQPIQPNQPQSQQQQALQPQQQQQQQQSVASSPGEDAQPTVCTECAACEECAAKQLQDEECVSTQCQEDIAQLSVPHVTLVPIHNNSPERRVTQKEIIAGEERPKYIAPVIPRKETEVTERRIVREATEDVTTIKAATATLPPDVSIDKKPPLPAKPESIPAQISGILKGGKLWKNEIQTEEIVHPTSDDDSYSKRSVRFLTENNKNPADPSKEGCDDQALENAENEGQINELIPVKKHSTLFHNVLRPNSAVRQLFPTAIHPTAPATALTHEALKAFEESKRGGLVSNLLSAGSDTDTIRRTIERNALRRSLIKKKSIKPDMTLEERIKQLTCDIDEPIDSAALDQNAANLMLYGGSEDLERRDSPAGEENPAQSKYIPDKSFSPSSSASSSSSGSTSAYRKISDIFNRDRRQEKIPEAEENPIECRCPAAPDLGMGVQVPAAHTQIHQTPPRQTEPRRQFLSTLAPLTACVAGQKDDFSYYTLAAGDRNSTASAQCSDYSLGDIESALFKDESRKVAPDVIAGTPGQEQDELVIFAQQEANRTDKIKKRYSNEQQAPPPTSNASSDDDEQNDYGFNKRPSVRGIKPKFGTTNEIIQQMQAQLSQPMPSQQNKPFNVVKQSNSIGSGGKIQTQTQTTNTMPQNPAERSWNFYTEADQRAAAAAVATTADLIQHSNYYQAMPAQYKQTFHGHEESLMYQNCQSVSMEQHYGRFARSPTRRPESPPPLRNYHQTMVLIPYNTESYAQFTSNDQQTSSHQFRRQNVLEYQQVTQQTIRVPIGYTIPGMQLHLVAGQGAQQQQHQQQQQQQQAQYTQNPRLVAPRSFNFPHDANNMKFAERGVPEGSAATSHTDCKNLMSPTSSQGQNQCNQSSAVSPAVPGAVFYAMNV